MLRYARMKTKDIPEFRRKLLAWYRTEKRKLPWRLSKDPYSILVSEIMLQQTQVDTVIPYYERWLKKFPDFETLAAADEATVLKFWQGLGYYRRAKMLHQTAKAVFEIHAGKLPSHPAELLNLPGIGRYTAGAIASIAFDAKAAIVDGNVIRIITRINAIKDNTAEKSTLEKIWQIAGDWLPEKNTGDFNQAMMELGATICKPQNPDCERCPVAKYCDAQKTGTPENYPFKNPGAKITKLKEFAFFMRDKQKRILVKKQRKGERWADLWTLPHFQKIEDGLTVLGLEKNQIKKLRRDKHAFTRYSITLETFHATAQGKACNPGMEWMHEKEIRKQAFPAVYQKILDGVLNHAH